MTNSTSLVLAGCGYTGRELARQLQHRDLPVLGLVARQDSLQQLQGLGIDAQRWDLDANDTPPTLPSVCRIAYLVPPSRAALEDLRLARFLAAVPPGLQKLVYVSTTGVYGDQRGQPVSEDIAPAPGTDRARRRVDAESKIRRWCEARNIPWVILRTPGIYGPGRLPLQAIREQRPIINTKEAYPGNRIHRDDLAMILRAALCAPRMAGIYNVSDGNPMSASEFTLRVAECLQLPPPPQVTRAQMRRLASARRWSFLSEARTIDTTRLMTHLNQPLLYADPLDGIRASI